MKLEACKRRGYLGVVSSGTKHLEPWRCILGVGSLVLMLARRIQMARSHCIPVPHVCRCNHKIYPSPKKSLFRSSASAYQYKSNFNSHKNISPVIDTTATHQRSTTNKNDLHPLPPPPSLLPSPPPPLVLNHPRPTPRNLHLRRPTLLHTLHPFPLSPLITHPSPRLTYAPP